MKTFLLFLSFYALHSYAQGSACKVYGISDGPQKMTCTFPKKIVIQLSCQNGTYFLNQSKVENAFHMDVEEGSSPLVFKAKDMTLTTVAQSAQKITAELDREQVVVSGSCQL